MLDEKNILIGVCGGIAVYKVCDLVSRLKKMGANIKVVMTKSAAEFVSPLTFETLSQNYVVTDMFSEIRHWEVEHIELAKWADVMVIAPATANVIGKVSNGIADDMLSTVIMATKSKVVFAPAMNVNMYENRIVQDNINKLKEYGYYFIEPESGFLACGDIGKGKFPNTDTIIEHILYNIEDDKKFLGKKILVTAGPTKENIDPVRFISNFSSGKMGYEIARVLSLKGGDVTLVSGPSNERKDVFSKYIKVESTEGMLKAVIDDYDSFDIVIMSAAVADYRPKNICDKKIKKRANENFTIELVKNPDILKLLGEKKQKQILIGFAAETNDLIQNAKEKLERKNLDMIIANNVSLEGAGFNSDTNIIKILKRDGSIIEYPKMSKYDVACKISEELIKLI